MPSSQRAISHAEPMLTKPCCRDPETSGLAGELQLLEGDCSGLNYRNDSQETGDPTKNEGKASQRKLKVNYALLSAFAADRLTTGDLVLSARA